MNFLRRTLLSLAVLAGLVVPASAVTTILWAAAGEDIDVTCTGTCTVTGSSANYRSTYVRAALGTSGAVGDPPANRFAPNATFSNASTIWVHAVMCEGAAAADCSATTSTTLNEQLIRLIDTAGNAALIVRGTGNAGEYKISSRTAGGVFTDLLTCTGGFGATPTRIDILVVFNASGTLTCYNNGVQINTFSGSTLNGDGAANLNNIAFSGISTGNTTWWSEMIVAAGDSRPMSVLNLLPSGNGNATQWGSSGAGVCGSVWPVLNNTDAPIAFSATNNQLQQCTVTSSAVAGAFTVDAVAMTARAIIGSTGPQHFDFLTRTGGSDFTSSDQAPNTSNYTNFGPYLQATNPQTTVQWLFTDLTAAGFNIGLKSTP